MDRPGTLDVRFHGLSADPYRAGRQIELLWGAVAEFLEHHENVDRTGLRRSVVSVWRSSDVIRSAAVYRTKGGAVVAKVLEVPGE